MLLAFWHGILGASSLLLGALLGVFWQPRRTLSAAIMAFGSGALLSALAFGITLSAYSEGGVWPLVLGFAIGCGLFATLTQIIDRLGGFLRKPASQRRFLFQTRQAQTSAILDDIIHVDVVKQIPPGEAQALVSLLRPLTVKAQETLFYEGDVGDWFGLIVRGEADVIKSNHPIALLKEGDVFGEMALLTGEPRSASIIARTDMDIYRLNREHFDDLMLRSPHLSAALSRVLARRLQSANNSQTNINYANWRRQAIDSVELDLSPAEEARMVASLSPGSAPVAIMVGTMLDNIPEALVIGMGSVGAGLSSSFLLAVFISNFPEALSSATGMRQNGTSIRRILSLWTGQVILCGFCAVGGSILQTYGNHLTIATTHAIAGGAILSMLSSTMMPEAYELGGATVSISTILGFLVGFLIAAPDLFSHVL